VDHFEIARVAVAVLHLAGGLTLVGAVDGVGALVGLLRALPSFPGLALDAVDLSELDFSREVEVADRFGAPLGLDLFEVEADRRLLDANLGGDLGLGVALEVQIGDVLPAAVDSQPDLALGGHLSGSLGYSAPAWQAR
jgi:hypothetical protein